MTIMSEIKSIIIAVLTLVLGVLIGFCSGCIAATDYYVKNDEIENEVE